MISRTDKKCADTAHLQEEIAFSDLFAIDDIQQLQDEFALATGVASIITTPNGVPITKPSNFCRLCSTIIRNTEKGLANCYKSDAIIGRPNPDGPIVKTCMSGGLWDAGAGITVEGQHIANWLIGQVRDETQTDDQMIIYADEIGVDRDSFLKAYNEVPAMTLDRFNNIASMLYTLANQISSVAYQNVKQTQLIDKLTTTETKLRQQEKELFASEHLLRIVVDNLPDAMIYQLEIAPDGQRNFTYVSENIIRINHVSADSVLADANVLYSQIHPDDLPDLVKTEKDAVQNMKLFRYETRFVLPNGDVKWFQFASSPRKLGGGVIAWDGIEIDITDRKKAEEEQAQLEELLRQSQKIEAIGQLAGGIAHDLNNMLSPIIGYAELLLLNSNQSQNNRKAISGIIDAGFKARDLVQQLLAFSRKQTLNFGPTNLNTIVLDFEELLRRTIREDIEIVTTRSPDISLIQADVSQLEQVIMNLVVNARDAMPEGGQLLIETSQVEIPKINQRLEIDVPGGQYVKLSVRDRGQGISQNIKDHIFEPFFSTKGSKGTGLGLATVYGIVTQHNGTISVCSTPDEGTEISIYLPVSKRQALPVKIDKLDQHELRGDETVVLVEDNKQVLETTKAILQQQGYNVLSADNGKKGLEIVQNHAASIKLLITDVVMPGMNGKELFLKAKKIKPDLIVLYMSGYNDDIIGHGGILDESTSFIQKPFSLSALCTKIRAILGSE